MLSIISETRLSRNISHSFDCLLTKSVGAVDDISASSRGKQIDKRAMPYNGVNKIKVGKNNGQ